MARARALSDLILDVRKRADVGNATLRFPDTDVTEWINQSIADLYNQIVSACGRDFFSTTTSFPGDGSTQYFPFPADFFQLASVKLDVGSGRQMELEPFTEMEEAEYFSIPQASSLRTPAYALRGNNILVLPTIPLGQNILLRYISAPVRLVNNTDTFDGYGGWEEFVVVDAARKLATKQRAWDLVGQLRIDCQNMRTLVAGMAPKRDRGRPERQQDVRTARRWNRFVRYRWGG